MKPALRITLLTTILTLGACSTYEGLKSDLSSGYHAVAGGISDMTSSEKEKKQERLAAYDGTCPPISARTDLTHLIEFSDPAKAGDATKVSEATMTSVKNSCKVENGGIIMQIDLAFTGETGPKARAKPTDKPSFAYPYFVAVTDEKGNVVSKEIFAVTLAYDANQKTVIQDETIYQNMPVPDTAAGQTFHVITGFQLSADQLAYNAAHPVSTKSP